MSAELILAHVLGQRRLDVLIRPESELGPAQAEELRWLVRRRGRGEPVAYILGQKEFYGRQFQIDPRALIPRPETEHLVDLCKSLPAVQDGGKAADICAGCGNLGVTLCCEFPGLQCILADISTSALSLARENAGLHFVSERTLCTCQHLAEGISSSSLDLAVCNPPYVPQEELDELSREVAGFEPRIALDGGSRGTEAALAAANSIAAALKPGGHLLLETGWDQARQIQAHLSEQPTPWAQIHCHYDLQGHPRVVSAEKVS